MQLDPRFESFRGIIFAALRKPLDRLPEEIKTFEASVNEAIELLESQFNAATLPRVKTYYKAEQERLKQRVENLKKKVEVCGS